MALQSLTGAGVWVPYWVIPNLTTQSTATYFMDATGELVALVCKAPRTGNIDRFDFQIAAVANSPDNGLRASLQSVSATTGQPSGTILGATNGAHVTYAHTVTTGWKSTNFGEVAAVTRGDVIALVIDNPTFTAGDSVTIMRLDPTGSGGTTQFPYGISVLTTKNGQFFPNVALHYTDGYARISPFIPGIESGTSVSFNSGTAVADEWGMAFTLPFPAKINRVAVQLAAMAAASDFEVIVYDSGDAVLSTTVHDGDIKLSTATGVYDVELTTEVTLAANSVYRVTVRPTSANNVTMSYWVFNSLELMDTMGGGQMFYMTSRLNQAGSWTNYNTGTFRRPNIALQLSAFDDGVGGGGGGGLKLVGTGGLAG